MQVVRMKAERRTALGRNRLGQLRSQGWMPAVVYGESQEPVSIAISEWELDQHVKAHHRVFQLEIGGQPQAAFLQQISWHATSDRPLHADFKRIDLTKPIDAEVEVALTGHPVGISKGGNLIRDHATVRVRCLPTQIPDSIAHDVSKLEIDDYVYGKDLAIPAGVTLLTPLTAAIAHVAKIVVVEVAPAPTAVPAEGEAPAAGAAGAAGAAAPAAGAAAPKAGEAPAKDAAKKPEKDKK
ncbi:MAG: 50S ribosomal protein L25 [Planctomycetota bacterium]